MSNTPLPEDRIPVIVGVGEIVDRPKNIAAGREPLALLEHAVRRAEADSGAKLLGDLGSLDVVNFLSWRYRDPDKQLAERLGVARELYAEGANYVVMARWLVADRLAQLIKHAESGSLEQMHAAELEKLAEADEVVA